MLNGLNGPEKVVVVEWVARVVWVDEVVVVVLVVGWMW